MALQIGIVGLPNVGKSTLFSAITKKQVDCANYPFCTIDPNVGVVEVPDERLAVLAEISTSKKITPTVIEFLDIAGLVKGAAEGQGLGNKFLSNIRETDAIAQVVRAFEDTNILHVDGSINPLRDVETINTELALADLEQIAKRKENIEKQMKSGKTKELEAELAAVSRAVEALNGGIMLRDVPWPEDERKVLKRLNPLTLKPMLYVVNVSEAQLQDDSWKECVSGIKHLGSRIVPVCVKMEADISTVSEEEKKEYLEMAGQTRSGLDELIKQAYDVLGLITFLTTGEDETRAWTVTKGLTAPQAAGKIHTDFEKNFIRAEVTSYDDYVACGGEVGSRDKGKTRVEGKEYVMRDGDVCYFRVGV
ncbi:MAG: redox-regulated ATPase YchF [Patescibacteria group bacterium]